MYMYLLEIMHWYRFSIRVWILFFTFKASVGDCDTHCTSCSGNTCFSCLDGSFPYRNNCLPCLPRCQQCSDGNGCDYCKPGFWNLKHGCNDHCAAGCEVGVCYKYDGSCTCKRGYYGSRCDKLCSTKCSDNECFATDGSCTCVEGYFGYRCEKKCNVACKDCTDDAQCTSCPVGRYGPWCTQVCMCNGGSCHIATGQCECPTCETCDRSTGKCTRCKDTSKYGDICQHQCGNGCANQSCDIASGECHACNHGYFGLYCNNTCDKSCSQSGCERDSGRCHECLSPSTYGDFCNIPCSYSCNNRQCDRIGECTSGCIINHYGRKCQMLCSNNCKPTATGVLCDDQGRCLEGCVHGFAGEDCSAVAPGLDIQNKRSRNEETTSTGLNTTAAVMGSLFSAVIVALVIVIVVIARRKLRPQTEPQPDPQPQNIYQGLDANRQQCTYSVLNQDRVASAVVYDNADPPEARVTVMENQHLYYNTVQ